MPLSWTEMATVSPANKLSIPNWAVLGFPPEHCPLRIARTINQVFNAGLFRNLRHHHRDQIWTGNQRPSGKSSVRAYSTHPRSSGNQQRALGGVPVQDWS